MRQILKWICLPLLLWLACFRTLPDNDTGLSEFSGASLVPITYENWKHRLEESKGAIVVVDFWATWCNPCLERFPQMVKLHDTYSSSCVRFISICLDDPSDREAVDAARRFLEEKNATFQNYLMDENVLDAFENLDLIGIPAVFIYDRIGNLKYRLTGDDPRNQFTDQDVEDAIKELIALYVVEGI